MWFLASWISQNLLHFRRYPPPTESDFGPPYARIRCHSSRSLEGLGGRSPPPTYPPLPLPDTADFVAPNPAPPHSKPGPRGSIIKGVSEITVHLVVPLGFCRCRLVQPPLQGVVQHHLGQEGHAGRVAGQHVLGTVVHVLELHILWVDAPRCKTQAWFRSCRSLAGERCLTVHSP